MRADHRFLLLVLAGSLVVFPLTRAYAAAERGREVYKRDCAPCHGKQGRGDGEKSRRMGFRPRDFELGSFKCRCTPMGELPTDEDLVRTVTLGMPGTAMQPWGEKLSGQEIRDVVQYVKTISPHFAEETAPSCIPLPEPPASSDRTVAEGKQIYKILECFRCHGPSGRGDGPSAGSLVDDWGNKIRAYDFTKRNRFKCGGERRDLYRTLLTGLTGTPMPSYGDAFLFPAGDPPEDLALTGDDAGAKELAAYLARQPDAAALDAMTDEARKGLIDERAWALVDYLLSLGDPSP